MIRAAISAARRTTTTATTANGQRGRRLLRRLRLAERTRSGTLGAELTARVYDQHAPDRPGASTPDCWLRSTLREPAIRAVTRSRRHDPRRHRREGRVLA